ncbi:MAG TPA: hypothetical protein VF795_09005 [Desulfuromonadaceae bacterium]
MDPRGIAHLLSREHPQTIAVVLARLKSDQTGDIIGYLPRHLQGDVISRIAALEELAPEVLREIDEFIAGMLNPNPARPAGSR